jgi:biotin-dependent carboxylase-like uncharacterized protein
MSRLQSVEVIAPGLSTTLQDRGRRGRQAFGIGRAGAADRFSLQVANRLLGNPADAAALEITLLGPTLRFAAATEVAWSGGEIDAECDGIGLPGQRPLRLPAGAVLRFGAVRRGCRAYLAVDGGWQAPRLLGSRATDLRGGFGGIEGRALRAGDQLAAPLRAGLAAERLTIARWWVDPSPDLAFDRSTVLHLLPGSDALEDHEALYADSWRVDPASNRQGLRLRGTPLALADRRERISAPVLPGTLQLPPDGAPILLLAEAQTVGGYARIGQVIAADLPRAAQLRPGQALHFRAVDEATAWGMLCAQRQRLARMGLAIDARRA